MRKIHLLLCLVLSCPFAFSQTAIKGVLVTIDSKQPIPYANVYLAEHQSSIYVGTITDMAGRFEIKNSSTALADSLTISCVGFETLKIHHHSIKQDSIFMRESTTELTTIVVSDLSAEDYILKCIDRIPQNYKNALFINRGFNWQSFQVDNVYKKMTTSFVTIEYENLIRSTKRKVSYDSTITLSTNEFIQVIPMYDSLDEYIYFDLIRTGAGVLNPEQLREWRFAFAYEEGENQNNVMIIEAKSSGKLVNNFKFYINTDDWAFRKIEYLYQWPTGDKPAFLTRDSMIKNSSDTVQYALNTIHGVMLYEKTRNKYNLKYLFNEIKYTQYQKGLEINSPIESFQGCLRNELVISYSKEYRTGDIQFHQDRKVRRTDFEQAIIHKGFHEAIENLHR